jgi:hypothetical protein
MILMSRFGTLPEINRFMRVQMLLTDGFGGFGGIASIAAALFMASRSTWCCPYHSGHKPSR